MEQRINLFAPEVRKNPYPYYARMRRESPVCQVDPGNIWVVSRYASIMGILKNPELFSSTGLRVSWRMPWLKYNPLVQSIISMDPPEHTRIRGLVTRAFGSPAITSLLPRVRERARGMLDRLATLGEAEFIAELAGPLPAFVIGELLGLDASLHRHFKQWSDDLVSISPAVTRKEDQERIAKTVDDLSAYLREVIASRRKNPREDLVSFLVRDDLESEPLEEQALLDFLTILLVAGFETTATMLANALVFLSERPDMVGRLRAEPGLIAKFVEELLRYDSPSHGAVRTTTDDVVIDGVQFPAGRTFLLLLASANRDEEQFPDPDRFDLDRKQGGVAFGYGIHYCLGANLARAEARIVLEELLARFRGVERLHDEVRYNTAITVRGPVELPLRFIAG